ncbi:4-amino-4-deoxy-L-arabinose transferase [Hymenobacter daecheongensis DSM 21074]|uniref:4-amino-4-deoxy-L-arabinose transferase n=1 Tax=Hymenobacter daecheongensis DSM 21074 TaxID=1121955 RepID=A0A1M6ILR1_9BACT|nr:glycosyltransferase family 39 protein [Hymenobacter daecheongensis]SHJ35436.1 4-amino-4-deoxy-L-arabinose transferase [Hymenobacter daecheongensis DSM 21074]
MPAPLPSRARPFSLAALWRWWWLPLLPAAGAGLLWRLGAAPLQVWDEARLAVNAAEMLRSGNWLVAHYAGQPDLWNTKPPLLIWLQALSISLLGYSEWAVRLPTALAALALVALVAAFARRWLGGPLAGLLAGLALLSSKGFITHHVARTADYETLLLLFLTAQLLAAFAWLQTRQRRYLLLAGAAVALAVLTKSVAGLFFLPGILLEITRRGRLSALLRQPATWLAAVLALAPPALWYWLREQAAPGYLQAVWQNELGGRMLSGLEDHAAPWYWYLTPFVSQQFLLWTPWVLLSGWLLLRRPVRRPVHRFFTLAATTGGVFLLIISSSTTKLAWYSAPLFPLLALVLGAGLAVWLRQCWLMMLRRVAAGRPLVWGLKPGLAVALLVGAAFIPSFVALHLRLGKEYRRRYDVAAFNYGPYLRWQARQPGAPTSYVVAHASTDPPISSYNAPLEFYALTARQSRHDTVQVLYPEMQGLAPGQLVVVCGAAAHQALRKYYRVQPVQAQDSCATLRVEAVLPQPPAPPAAKPAGW